MPTFLITGIAGFVGSSIARTLVQQGHTVRGIDDLSSGRLENLEEIRKSVSFEEADVRDLDAMNKACKCVDYVLHQAAVASVPRSVEDPLTTHDINLTSTLKVLLAAHENGVKRVVFAASSSAYGDQGADALREDMSPQPLSPYAVQKLSAEYYIQSFCRMYDIEGVCLRYFNIFGPRQAADSPYSGVIARFIDLMLEDKTPTINGDGSSTRDFTYVKNAVQANLLASFAPAAQVNGKTFNVGTGRSHTLRELYQTLADVIGFRKAPKYGPAKLGDIRHSLADIGQARTYLEYVPDMDFRAGLEATVAWYKTQSSQQLASYK